MKRWPRGAAIALDRERGVYVEICEPAGQSDGDGCVWYHDLRCGDSYNLCGEHWFHPLTDLARTLLRLAAVRG